MSIVNLDDMICEARRLLDDRPETTGFSDDNLALLEEAAEAQDESNLLWTTAELKLYANEAVNEVAIRTNLLGSNVDVSGFNLFTIGPDDDPWQAVDERILRVLRVTWDGRKLDPTSRYKLDLCSRSWEEDTGEPTLFVWDQGSRQVSPYPKPTAEGALRLETRHLPLSLMVDMEDEPAIPAHMRQPAVFWMLHLAYLKNDADTKDDALSAKYDAMFTNRFGPRPTFRELEFNNRSMAVTPRGRFEYY